MDADELEQKRLMLQARFEMRKRNQNKVFIERDLNRLQYTNSCWEIQKVLTFQGGPILMNDVCRIKHIGTGKYLAVSDQDRRELTLKENSDEGETLFRIHRDTYRPPRKRNGKQKELDLVNGDPVLPYEMVILETF
jgi:MIR domain